MPTKKSVAKTEKPQVHKFDICITAKVSVTGAKKGDVKKMFASYKKALGKDAIMHNDLKAALPGAGDSTSIAVKSFRLEVYDIG